MPTKKASEKYELDSIDGLRREIVGHWAPEKHLRLRHYIDITRAVRRKFGGNTSYIDLYSGPGRARIAKTGEIIDGSAVLAASEAARHEKFGTIHIGDIDAINVEASESRLVRLGMKNIHSHVGSAKDTVSSIVHSLSKTGLHLAFLDPYSIHALPFEIIKILATKSRMDLIIHVSSMDLQRNVRQMMGNGRLSHFVPGWESNIDQTQRHDLIVRAVFQYWLSLLRDLGFFVSHNIERVSGSKNQTLYWLVLASRHEIADQFWGQVSNVESQRRLF